MVRIINRIIDLKFHREFLTSEAFDGESQLGDFRNRHLVDIVKWEESQFRSRFLRCMLIERSVEPLQASGGEASMDLLANSLS